MAAPLMLTLKSIQSHRLQGTTPREVTDWGLSTGPDVMCWMAGTGLTESDLAIFSTMTHNKYADDEKGCQNLIILCKMD